MVLTSGQAPNNCSAASRGELDVLSAEGGLKIKFTGGLVRQLPALKLPQQISR